MPAPLLTEREGAISCKGQREARDLFKGLCGKADDADRHPVAIRNGDIGNPVRIEIGDCRHAGEPRPVPVIGDVLDGPGLCKPVCPKRPDLQPLDQMRHGHQRHIQLSVTIKICNAGRIEPAKGLPDERGLCLERDRPACSAIGGKGCALIEVCQHQKDFVFPVAVEIGEARLPVLKDLGLIKHQRQHPPVSHFHPDAARFVIAAHNEMPIAGDRRNQPGFRNVILALGDA